MLRRCMRHLDENKEPLECSCRHNGVDCPYAVYNYFFPKFPKVVIERQIEEADKECPVMSQDDNTEFI